MLGWTAGQTRKRPLVERSYTVRFEVDGPTFLHLVDGDGADVRFAPDH